MATIQDMRTKTQAQDTATLLGAYNLLGGTTSRNTRTEAEKLTLAVIGGELTGRIRAEIQTMTDAELLASFAELRTMDYSTADMLHRMAYGITEDLIEARGI